MRGGLTTSVELGLHGPASLSDTERMEREVLAKDRARFWYPRNKLESDIISFLIIMQPSWISSLTLFNQQRNGNGQRSPKLTRRIRSADSKDNSHLELHMPYLTVFHKDPMR